MRSPSFAQSAAAVALIAFFPLSSQADPPAAEPQVAELLGMDLSELLNQPIVSASNVKEKLSEAPATVIVISRADLKARGYADLSQVLDDLPGMQIARSFSDTYIKNYWRGYRNDIGDPFLVMIDGIVFNSLYFNQVDVPLTATPISSIERIEVVYGPASSVYGANAFMGVINIITTKDPPADGLTNHITLEGSGGVSGAHASHIGDANAFYKRGDFRLSLSARIENGTIDTNTNENYEYTKNKYYADKRLWGDIVNNPNLGGAFGSQTRDRAFDLRAFLGKAELGIIYLLSNNGYGTSYPGDKVQNNSVWAMPELTAFVRHTVDLDEKLSSTTLLRYRESDVRGDSYFVDAYENGTATTGSAYSAEFSWWPSLNRSVSVNEDVTYKPNDMFSVVTGVRYEQKDLQKAYGLYGQLQPVNKINLGSGSPFYPVQPAGPGLEAQNRITTSDSGVYAQGKIQIDPHNALNIGARYDRNSVYGGDTTVRAGYVLSYGSWGAKALFGQAYQEPPPRLLFGGWSGSGSDPALLPERSNTFELNGSYTTNSASVVASLWAVRNTNTISGAKNLGARNVQGADLHGQLIVPQTAIPQWKVWAYYSRLFSAKEDLLDKDGNQVGTGRIGDLSNYQFLFGSTASVNEHLNATVLGHWIGARPTVATNPIPQTDAYFTLDLCVNAIWRGVTLMGKVNNLTDAQYFHPGLRNAKAGITPGDFTGAGGLWSGSRSYYSSLLAQPGRYFTVALKMDI